MEQIVAVLKQAELGMPAAELIRRIAIPARIVRVSTDWRRASAARETRMPITSIRHRRMPEIADLVIRRLRPNNPRRADTHGWRSWESYGDGMTVKEYIALGGDVAGPRRRHLDWDIEHGFVELVDRN